MTASLGRSLARHLVVALALVLPGPVAAVEPSPTHAWFQQGVKAYERGAFEEAAASWKAAAQASGRARRPAEQLRALFQLKMLDNPRYDHPGFWAPFLLINNWP